MKPSDEKGTVAVVMGGASSEREISLRSGRAVHRALVEEGVDAVAVELTDNNGEALIRELKVKGVGCVFIALHGAFGENGELQAILQAHGIPFVGSGENASRIAFNKAQTQKLMQENGVNVADFIVVSRDQKNLPQLLETIELPVFIKPAEEGSSIGISYVVNKHEVIDALQAAWRYSPQALIERAINGREFTVGILKELALPVVEICAPQGFFSFAAKYEKGRTQYHVPAPLDGPTSQSLQKAALRAFHVLGCRHFARADFKMDEEGRHYFLEMNTIPGFTETSLLPKAAAAAGISFNQLCLKLTEMAYDKKEKASSIDRGH
jgi:D-alanine-D-alanine ligase